MFYCLPPQPGYQTTVVFTSHPSMISSIQLLKEAVSQVKVLEFVFGGKNGIRTSLFLMSVWAPWQHCCNFQPEPCQMIQIGFKIKLRFILLKSSIKQTFKKKKKKNEHYQQNMKKQQCRCYVKEVCCRDIYWNYCYTASPGPYCPHNTIFKIRQPNSSCPCAASAEKIKWNWYTAKFHKPLFIFPLCCGNTRQMSVIH